MISQSARDELNDAAAQEEIAHLDLADLQHVSAADIPAEVPLVRVVSQRKPYDEWQGSLYVKDGKICAQIDRMWSLIYWQGGIGLKEYMDLLQRVIETRAEQVGDVEFFYRKEDPNEDLYDMSFLVNDLPQTNLYDAYARANQIAESLEQPAKQALELCQKSIESIIESISPWHGRSLEELLCAVENGSTPDLKGRALEELACRLFESIEGFQVATRVRTATEEIDIVIINGSDDPRLRRESAFLIVECKNWTGKCGKDELVLFCQKIRNRSGRCSLGVLISWNGFAQTVTKEMLRGTRENSLVLLLTRHDIKSAVDTGRFSDIFMTAWNEAATV